MQGAASEGGEGGGRGKHGLGLIMTCSDRRFRDVTLRHTLHEHDRMGRSGGESSLSQQLPPNQTIHYLTTTAFQSGIPI